METFIVALIVMVAVVGLLSSLVKTFRSEQESGCGCGSSCGGCSLAEDCGDVPAKKTGSFKNM